MNLFSFIQYALPKHTMTVLAGKFANYQGGMLTSRVITWFIGRYSVNMAEAEHADIAHYKTFNDFFTRALKAGARPLSDSAFVCPVDGAVSQVGAIKEGRIFQAKGHDYSALELLAGNQALAEKFHHGAFATIYLSPKDYHRIHMPCNGKLISMAYVPGDLFSVNPTTAAGIPRLFARNERVICEFDGGNNGRFIMVLVGATIVGSMATVWHGIVNPPRAKTLKSWDYANQAITLKQGEEMGRFLLGSTVVMLFEPAKIQINTTWQASTKVLLGELMG